MVKQFMLDVGKSSILSLIPQHNQQRFDQIGGLLRQEQTLVFAMTEEFVWVAELEGIAPIGPAGRQPVAEHFSHVFYWHIDAHNAVTADAVIRPVFEMVAIPAFMMEPGGAITLCPSLGIVGTVVALIVFDASQKLHRGVFGKIVGQPLPVEPQPEAVFSHQCSVVVDGF